MAALPVAESLTLSATLFHADVDSWLPASFGVSRPDADKAKDWEAALRQTARDRLGLGHPDLTDPLARARAATQRAGIETLRKLKGREKKGDDSDLAPTPGPGSSSRTAGRGGRDDSDDDESRTRSVSKKKTKTKDAFASKGKNAVHPLLNLRNPIPGYVPPVGGQQAQAEAVPKAPATTATVPALVVTGIKRAREDDEDADGDDKAEGDEGGDDAAQSKAAARREKRKRAKARKAEAARAAVA